MNLKGSLPLLILHILSEGPTHGYAISRHISQITNGKLDFKEGTLYPTLHKLAKNGFIEGYEGEQRGRRRRYYQLTDIGGQRLKQELLDWDDYVEAVNKVLAAEHIPNNG